MEESDNFKHAVNFFGTDFNPELLAEQQKIFGVMLQNIADFPCFKDVVEFFRKCSRSQRELFSQVIRLVKLIAVMPATNATSERLFSGLRRVKTFL